MKNKTRLLNLLFIPVSLLCLFLMFRNYTQYLDISMVDETGYMELLNFNPLIYPGGYGPLYILSYKIIYQFIPDFVNLHYFFIIGLTWLPSVALFYFLRSRKTSFIVAFAFSWLLFISTYIAAFDWWARTAHYSIAFGFVFLALTYSYKNQPIKFLLFAFFFFKIFSYVRPELNVASYLILLAMGVIIIYQKIKKIPFSFKINKIEKLVLALLFLIYAGMFLVWKSPTQNTGRMYFALGQHYTMNYNKWNNLERIDFIHWEEVFKNKFGNSKNLGDMFKNNPSETIKHITENITHYIDQTLDFTTELCLPKSIFKIHYAWKYLLLISIFFLMIKKITWQYYKNSFINKIKEEYLFLLFALAFAIPSVLASFVIYPREHYFIMQLVFFIYIIYILVFPIISRVKIPTQYQTKLYLLFFVSLLLFFTPHVSAYKRYNNFNTYEKPNYLPYIHKIRNMKIDSAVTFLSFEILPVYLGKNFKGYPFFAKRPFYDSIIIAQNIDMMYISNEIIQNKKHQTDSQFLYFMNNYQNLGWQKLQLKNKNGYLIIKNDLLNNDAK